MKKYLLIIFLSCWCIGAGRMWDYGATDLYGIGNLTWVDQIDSGSAAADYCSSCTPGDPTDIMCEDAEGTNDLGGFNTAQCSGWSETIEANNTVTNASHSGDINSDQGCTNQGSYAIQIHVDNTAAGEDAYLSDDITAKSNVYGQFYLIVTANNLENSDYVSLNQLLRTTGGTVHLMGLMLWRNATDTVIRAYYRNSSDANVSSDSTATISNDTWYKIEYQWESGSTLKVWIDDSLEISETDNDTENVERLRIGSIDVLGSTAADSSDIVTYQVDMVGWDDDTIPSDCS